MQKEQKTINRDTLLRSINAQVAEAKSRVNHEPTEFNKGYLRAL